MSFQEARASEARSGGQNAPPCARCIQGCSHDMKGAFAHGKWGSLSAGAVLDSRLQRRHSSVNSAAGRDRVLNQPETLVGKTLM